MGGAEDRHIIMGMLGDDAFYYLKQTSLPLFFFTQSTYNFYLNALFSLHTVPHIHFP